MLLAAGGVSAMERQQILDSYPSPLNQIIANLINNSLIHAFSEDDAKEISISGRQEGDTAIIEYRDNRAGTDEATASRAFDSFFTTRLGTGGSGLGLYITRNLTQDVLNGTLTFETAPDQGMYYTFSLPLNAPPQNHSPHSSLSPKRR
jgi:signal transduction histidine kinase